MHIRSMEELQRVVASVGQPVEDDARARKRRRLVEVATALFMRHGYRKTSIDDVAAEAGIAKGTVYLYFKTKADLLVATVRAEKLAYLERVRPLFDEGIDGRERLRRYLRMSVELTAEMPLTSRTLGGDRDILAALSEVPPETMRASMELGMDFLGDLIAGATGVALPAESMREKALALTGVMLSVVMADERARFGLPLPRFRRRLRRDARRWPRPRAEPEPEPEERPRAPRFICAPPPVSCVLFACGPPGPACIPHEVTHVSAA